MYGWFDECFHLVHHQMQPHPPGASSPRWAPTATTLCTRSRRWIWEHFSFIHNMYYISFKTFISSKKINVDIPSKHKQLQQTNVQWDGESALWKYCLLNENSNLRTLEMLMPCCECWISPAKYLVCFMDQLVIRIKVKQSSYRLKNIMVIFP